MTILSRMDVVPQRLTARASAILLGAGAFDATAIRLDCGHSSNLSLTVTYAEGAVGGGAPAMMIEGFNGLVWDRLTIDNTGTLVIGNNGTTSVVDQFVKNFDPRPAFSEEFAVVLAQRWYAIRVKFAEYGQVGTPGTLSCIAVFTAS